VRVPNPLALFSVLSVFLFFSTEYVEEEEERSHKIIQEKKNMQEESLSWSVDGRCEMRDEAE
jgi:hypothetical protein